MNRRRRRERRKREFKNRGKTSREKKKKKKKRTSNKLRHKARKGGRLNEEEGIALASVPCKHCFLLSFFLPSIQCLPFPCIARQPPPPSLSLSLFSLYNSIFLIFFSFFCLISESHAFFLPPSLSQSFKFPRFFSSCSSSAPVDGGSPARFRALARERNK